jgi:hypothetical protein
MATDRDRLHRIADLLDCPVSTFAEDGPPPGHLMSIGELIALWHGLERPEDRVRLLTLARTLAERHPDA